MAKYKVGDVVTFGNEWLLVLDLPDTPNVTFGQTHLFLGGYNPIKNSGPPSSDMIVLFNIFDIKRKVTDDD